MTVWADLGVSEAWVAETFYDPGDIVLGVDGAVDYAWICEVGGFSDITEPVWDVGASPMADGTVSWAVVPDWLATNPYTAFESVVQPTTPNSHAYRALGSGESGATEPAPWETDGDDTDDGGTGGSGGELIVPDPDDNAGGTGTDPIFVNSDVIYQVWPNPKLVYDDAGNPDLDGAHPGRDMPPLGVLTALTDDEGRRVRNNAGSLNLEMLVNEEEAAWLQPGNIVVAYRESLTTPPFASYIVGPGTVVVLSPDEGGGERVRWECPGTLTMLRDFSLLYRSLLPNADELRASPEFDDDGRWHWAHKLPIAMLTRLLEEQREVGTFYFDGRQNSPCPNLIWDFGRHIDSAGDPVDNEDADAYALPVGLVLYDDVLAAWLQIGLLIRDKPVINSAGHLRILLQSWVSDPGVITGITFAKGEDLTQLGEQHLPQLEGGTFIQVEGQVQQSGGDEGRHKYVTRNSTTLRERYGTIIQHLAHNSTSTTRFLNRVGDKALARTGVRRFGPGDLEFLESEGKIAFQDFDEWATITVDAEAGPYGWSNDDEQLSGIAWKRRENGTVAWAVSFGGDEPLGIVEIKSACECVQPIEGGET